ncbi:MAG: AAA family ATPase [Deltaproteobacteria bacterium]|nr:AAA family ATPase [Deltaproteobacteria bacterium]
MTDYTKFYGFTINPFNISTDPKFFFSAESHKEALAAMWYGIHERKGFVLILGEEGIGKTTLIHTIITMCHLRQSPFLGLIGKNTVISQMHQKVGDKVKIVLFHRGHVTFEKLLREILVKLKLPLRSEIKGTMMHDLYHYLIHSLTLGENVVVIIDEAHDISLEAIEELRLLSNLETSKSKLLQIILVGKPELNTKLRAEVIRQIRQRIVVNYHISPLTQEESRHYINHRLYIAGSSSAHVFTDNALALICRYGKGVPREINILCSNALALGFNLSQKKISASIVKKVRKEKEILTEEKVHALTLGIKRNLFRKISYAFLVLAVLAAGIFFGKDSLRYFIDAQKTSTMREKPGTKNEVATPLPAPFQKIQTPGVRPSAVSHPESEIIIKTIEAKRGTSLSSIALNHYQETNLTLVDHILELNPEITNPDLILVNQKIKIPEMSSSLLIKQSLNGTYKVHLETFATPKKAVRYMDASYLERGNLEVVLRKITPRETWYRVMAGPFAERDEALKAIEEMRQKGVLRSFQRP